MTETIALEAMRAAMRDACDLLAGRTHGNPARSAGHSARLRLESALAATTRAPKDSDPHPRWKPDDKSDRHPQTAAEWDYRNDPVGGAVERSVRRLNVACDYDDHRAPDQMAMVLRVDLSRALGRLVHMEAAFTCWRAGDALSTASQLQQALAEYLVNPTWRPMRSHVERIRSDVERVVLHLQGIKPAAVPPESPGTSGDTAS